MVRNRRQLQLYLLLFKNIRNHCSTLLMLACLDVSARLWGVLGFLGFLVTSKKTSPKIRNSLQKKENREINSDLCLSAFPFSRPIAISHAVQVHPNRTFHYLSPCHLTKYRHDSRLKKKKTKNKNKPT